MPWSRVTLLLLCGCTFFLDLGGAAITDSDEAFYAEASREMVESGEWLTPRFNYEDRWQKPVLYYWLTAATYLLTGATEWAARLWSALSGVGLVLLTASAARTAAGSDRIGWLAGAIAATCFGYFALARMALPDLPLAFCITLCIGSALAAADGRERAWGWAGVGAALGFVMKGPVALVIPALVLAPIAWRERVRLTISASGVAIAFALFALIGLPWYLAMLSTHGVAYAQSFFIGDNLERFATDRFNEPRSLWFYVPVLLGGLLPWSPYLLALAVTPLRDLVRRTRTLNDREWRLLFWALMPIVFYTVSVGKQPRYILPVLPPIAVLLAWAFAGRVWGPSTAGKDRQPALHLATWASVVLFASASLLLVRLQQTEIIAGSRAAWVGAGGLLISAAATSAVAWRRAWRAVPPVMAVSATILLLSTQFAVLSRPRPEPVERMATHVRQHRAGHERVGAYRAFVRNLVFYTGLRQEDLFDEGRALEFVKSPDRVLLVLPEADLSAIESGSGVTLRRLAEVTYVNTANIRLRTLFGSDPAVTTRVLLVSNR